MSSLPIRWTNAQLLKDVAKAKGIFRNDRIGEPLDLYNQFFAAFVDIFQNLIPQLPGLVGDPVNAKLLADLVRGKERQKAFRYLTAPPISEDDLKEVAESSLAPGVLAADTDKAKRVRDTVLSIIDPHRFPWVVDKRRPKGHEYETAVIASAALAAAREVETQRRNSSKDVQEAAVKATLAGCGFVEVPAGDIPMLTAAPPPRHYCGESRVAGTRADVVARLGDGRVMCIECKVSNSAVNSYKRVVHDTGGKAAHWYQQLGKAQVVPCAVLSGVFNPTNLTQVQDEALVYLFWQHRLDDLADYVKRK